MNRLLIERNLWRRSAWLLVLGLAMGLLLAGDLEAQDRGNPWAMPEQRAPAPGLRPYSDGRFAPRDYDPVDDRRRRDPRARDPLQSGGGGYLQYPSTGILGIPDARDYGIQDPIIGSPWSQGIYGSPSIYGSPNLGYPGLSPYGAYPGSGMLFPGTGLLTPGLLSPLYGSSPGTVPLYGMPF